MIRKTDNRGEHAGWWSPVRSWQSLTATVTATCTANARPAQPQAANHSCSAGLSWLSATPEKRKVGSSILPLTTTLSCADVRLVIVRCGSWRL
jgi:hypothetical protein